MSFEAGTQPRLLHIVEGQLQWIWLLEVLLYEVTMCFFPTQSPLISLLIKSLVLVTDGFFEKTRQNSEHRLIHFAPFF